MRRGAVPGSIRKETEKKTRTAAVAGSYLTADFSDSAVFFESNIKIPLRHVLLVTQRHMAEWRRKEVQVYVTVHHGRTGERMRYHGPDSSVL